MASKYLDKTYDGVWKVIKVTRKDSHSYYLLENTFNKRTCEINSSMMFLVAEGKTTVASIISSRIRKKEKAICSVKDMY